ncbi:MAG: VCBS repeat-containing protein, partial [Bacteriovorax sp.]|nr:VCBS repeat-containing protein [Bacteriovorax sp.]
MKKEILSLSMFLCIISSQIVAQSIPKSKIGDSWGLTDGPEVINRNIPGAPILGKPILIMGENQPIIADGHGIAAPAYYDFDDDGLKDLLIGEFGTGIENGFFVGNFMRFYRNIGDNNNPKFTGISYYARPFDKVQNNGTPLSTKQFCCMGFTPQFIDLDSDGKMDIISGQYNGHVRWFRGVEGGFDDGELLDQEGDPVDVTDYSLRMADNVKSQHYWLFSIANFGDLDNDGLLDMIVGGSSIRISKNIGTKSAPKFSKRELLLDIKGDPLKIGDFLTPKEKEQILNYNDLPAGGTHLISPIVFDWDQDGVLDILATNPY